MNISYHALLCGLVVRALPAKENRKFVSQDVSYAICAVIVLYWYFFNLRSRNLHEIDFLK